MTANKLLSLTRPRCRRDDTGLRTPGPALLIPVTRGAQMPWSQDSWWGAGGPRGSLIHPVLILDFSKEERRQKGLKVCKKL